jgi:hypothetical protein
VDSVVRKLDACIGAFSLVLILLIDLIIVIPWVFVNLIFAPLFSIIGSSVTLKTLYPVITVVIGFSFIFGNRYIICDTPPATPQITSYPQRKAALRIFDLHIFHTRI